MSKNIIGIKQADGTFYPILTRGKPAKKRLQITTASDNQTAAQITLFCASDESFSDAEYVDTLMIEGLKPHEKRAVDIDFVVSLDENDELSAEVYDKESGGSTNSAVSLVAIGSNNTDAENTFGISDEPVPFDSDTSSDALGLADLDDFDLPDPATISDDTPVTEIDETGWEEVIDTNLNGVFYCVRNVLPLMIQRKSGTVITVAACERAGFPGGTAYSASKAGVVGLTKALAEEVGPHGITVNCVTPVDPASAADAMMFLASANARTVNGEIIGSKHAV